MPFEPMDAPCYGQTIREIGAYLAQAQPGDEVAIRETHGHMLHYSIVKIAEKNPRRGRLYIAGRGHFTHGVAYYIKTGKNCQFPKGQGRLVIPTDAVRQFIENNPETVQSYKYRYDLLINDDERR